MKVVGIIPARMDSLRLPGKALRKISGRPLIDFVVARARRASGLASLLLATTARPVDAPLLKYADQAGLDVSLGDPEDVAGRLLDAAEEAGASHFARINGDSPFVDPALLDDAVEHIDGADLVSNIPDRTFPYGITAEVVRTSTLRRLHDGMNAEDREHVTSRLYDPELGMAITPIRCPETGLSDIRLVVDTEEDLELCSRLMESLGTEADTADYRQVARHYRRVQSEGKAERS